MSSMVDGRPISMKEITEMAQDSNIDLIFSHWSASRHSQVWEDYHINIVEIDGETKAMATCDSLDERKSHTWRMNTGNCAVSISACFNATSDDLGEYAPTPNQIEYCARAIAAICIGRGYDNCTIDICRTHGEQGDMHGSESYGQNTTCERWDLAILANGDEWGSGGDILRGKVNYYIQNQDDLYSVDKE